MWDNAESKLSAKQQEKIASFGEFFLSSQVKVAKFKTDNKKTKLRFYSEIVLLELSYIFLYCISAACFFEFWKRQEAVIAWEWDLETEDTEEETRPEFEVFRAGHATTPPRQRGHVFRPRNCWCLALCLYLLWLLHLNTKTSLSENTWYKCIYIS